MKSHFVESQVPQARQSTAPLAFSHLPAPAKSKQIGGPLGEPDWATENVIVRCDVLAL
jgi:hypothetical protein